MNAAVLVKQVVGPRGELVMDELSGMAVAQGVELCAAVGDGLCTAITVGPDTAADVLREAIAWGGTCSVMTDGVLLADPAFVGSDSLVTARALAAVLTEEGPFDLVLLGAESSDTATGQLGPQLVELLDLPFVAAARYLSMQGSWVHVRGRHEDGWLQAVVQLPAVVSCAAGLADPCDPEPAAQALVPQELIRTLAAASLGSDARGAVRLAGPTDARGRRPIAVVLEPDCPDLARGLLGFAAGLDANAGPVVAITTGPADEVPQLGAWGADEVVALAGTLVAEDVARAVAEWAADTTPTRVFTPSTEWGREVAGRTAVRLDSGRAAVPIESVPREALLMRDARGSPLPHRCRRSPCNLGAACG